MTKQASIMGMMPFLPASQKQSCRSLFILLLFHISAKTSHSSSLCSSHKRTSQFEGKNLIHGDMKRMRHGVESSTNWNKNVSVGDKR